MNRDELLIYLRDRKSRYVGEYGVRRIGLFGSYARGENKPESDIDIVVEMDPDYSALAGLALELERGTGRHVDLVRLRPRMSPSLRKTIDRDALYV